MKYKNLMQEMYGIANKDQKKKITKKAISKPPSLIQKIQKEINASPAKQLIREELLEEQVLDLRTVYYGLGDQIENLGWLLKRYTPIEGDRVIEKTYKDMRKMHDKLYKHLNKTYGNWD